MTTTPEALRLVHEAVESTVAAMEACEDAGTSTAHLSLARFHLLEAYRDLAEGEKPPLSSATLGQIGRPEAAA